MNIEQRSYAESFKHLVFYVLQYFAFVTLKVTSRMIKVKAQSAVVVVVFLLFCAYNRKLHTQNELLPLFMWSTVHTHTQDYSNATEGCLQINKKEMTYTYKTKQK